MSPILSHLLIVYRSLRGRGRRALRLISQLEIVQDFFNHGSPVDQANDLEPAAATGTIQRVGFVHLLQ
jgi:hypothetical protein